jgi:L-ascorbate metabolism protein UlaG (beta-lactamase superfamily)
MVPDDQGVLVTRLAVRRAWVRIDGAGTVVHLDPAWAKSFQPALPQMRGPADLVCISHSHKDHWQTHTLPPLVGPGILVLAPARAARDIERETGIRVRVVEPGEEVAHGAAYVRVVHAYERPGQAGRKSIHPRGEGVGFVVSLAGVRVYHAGDCGLIPELAELGPGGPDGSVDVACLPIGGRGFTMDVAEAAEAARWIRPRLVVPIHELETDPAELAALLAAEPEIAVSTAPLGEAIAVRPR